MAIAELEKLYRKNRDRFATVEGNLLAASGGGALRSVLVTACRPRQGATTVAACLAYALCTETGARTLLVDAATRHPRLHAWFEVPEEPGLRLLGDGTGDLTQALHATTFPNLWLLPAGSGVSPLNASRCRGLGESLGLLAKQFDYVLVDSDPLSAASGAALLAPWVDGVILVVEAGRTKRSEIADARTKIAQIGGVLLGTALNRAKA